MTVARPLAASLGCALLVANGACRLPGVSRAELPDAPIAMHYRTPEEARRYAEDWSASQRAEAQLGRAPRAATHAEGVAHTDELGAYLGGMLGAARGEGRTHGGRLALLDPRTGQVAVVAAALRGSIPLAWSRDRTRLLFAQSDRGDIQIWELQRRRETVRPVTQGPLAHTQGCYGPNGRLVAVEVDAGPGPRRSWVALSEEGGRGPFTPISPGPADHSPTCARDGSAVAYVRETALGRREIWIAEPAFGSEPRMLAPGRQPRFSSSSEWIVFSAPIQQAWRLWRMRRDGTARAPIGRGLREESSPAISPDGRFVAYVAAEMEPHRHLYLRRFDGSGDRILFADGHGDFPVW